MKFDIKALAAQQFKAMVTVAVPTNELDKDGGTVFAKAKFVGLFRCVPIETARKQMTELQAMQEAGDTMAAIEAAGKQIEEYFVGFEAVPGEELPFTNDGQPLASTPENIKLLLNSKEVRDAVQFAWQEARNKDVLAKNSKK
ncbi:hypothetical protein [Alishewanella jeotgali]|uniref:Phage protein n=1 Tax=Alishewanella jeotgali KCTC 22429 TaxID=1129374 RepID=H3Z9N6_9ALTE|nr:hypothetical protein [Alishewanella jeotgali]EHR42737.1 hypothetical protein AJE_00185 [Alishewanella jeotgali KCTC 22429]